VDTIEIGAAVGDRGAEILSAEALEFVAALEREFGERRRELVDRRAARQVELEAGAALQFVAPPLDAADSWVVAPAPADLRDRRCEITGPVERKMMINALNSGARVFMADFEDANSPTWSNVVEGQVNCHDAVRRAIALETPEKSYRLNADTATLMVRPRGWHLVEKHATLGGQPLSASIFDFGLFFFWNARELLERDSGPYFYLPKLESHLEARLWNDVFLFAQEALSIPRGSIRATVLVETIVAAFEMEAILWELREHSAGLNAGRWDYIFSVIKKFRHDPAFVLPDRSQVTMAVPFMRAYTELLVDTCHLRAAHAIGGMAAFIPSRRDPEVNERALARVREDKIREATGGFDGTWVAHPDLVPVATSVFDEVLGGRDNQLSWRGQDVRPSARDLLDVAVPGGEITAAGLRTNVAVGIEYLESWLRGVGAAALHNLMEDAATAEISRSQVWQWIRHGKVDEADVISVIGEEAARLGGGGRFPEARALFERVAFPPAFTEFLTLPAYDLLA
jgi:malate synthase